CGLRGGVARTGNRDAHVLRLRTTLHFGLPRPITRARVRRPALLVASLLAAAAAAVASVCVGDGGVAVAADTPFLNVRVADVTAFSATVSFETSQTVAARASYGLDLPVLWSPTDAAGTSHTFTLTGLHPDRTYAVWPQEVQEGDPIAGDPVRFRTAGF